MEAVIADQKLTSLSAFTPAAADILYGVDDPGGTPVSGKFTIEALLDVLKAPYLKTNEGLISFTQTLTGSDTSVALYLQGDYNTSGSTSLVDLAITDTASAATTTFIICERLDGGTATYWSLLKDGQTQMKDGSASSPILTFLSDTDTGLYRSGANTLGFATGGSARATLSSSDLQLNAAGLTAVSAGASFSPGIKTQDDDGSHLINIRVSLGAPVIEVNNATSPPFLRIQTPSDTYARLQVRDSNDDVRDVVLGKGTGSNTTANGTLAVEVGGTTHYLLTAASLN